LVISGILLFITLPSNLIVAHSIAVGALLLTNDKAFYNVAHHLVLEVQARPMEH